MHMSIRAIVVDDEPPARDELVYLLSRLDDITVVATASSATQAVESITTHSPDLVFLDIEMPGHDGFHVVEKIMENECAPLVIFVTAFNEYAIRAFEENAVDYILKPVEENRLQKSITRVRHMLSVRDEKGDGELQQHFTQNFEKMLVQLGRLALTRVSVEHQGRILLFKPEEIIFCRADDKKIWAHTKNEQFLCHGDTNLGKLEERLHGHAFFRANRGELVNMEKIREFSPWFNGKYNIVLDDSFGTEIAVSRSRVKAFKERLGL